MAGERTAPPAKTKGPGSPGWVGVYAWIQNTFFHPQIIIPEPYPPPLASPKILGADSVLCSHRFWLKSPWLGGKAKKSQQGLPLSWGCSRRRFTNPQPRHYAHMSELTSGILFRCFSLSKIGNEGPPRSLLRSERSKFWQPLSPSSGSLFPFPDIQQF